MSWPPDRGANGIANEGLRHDISSPETESLCQPAHRTRAAPDERLPTRNARHRVLGKQMIAMALEWRQRVEGAGNDQCRPSDVRDPVYPSHVADRRRAMLIAGRRSPKISLHQQSAHLSVKLYDFHLAASLRRLVAFLQQAGYTPIVVRRIRNSLPIRPSSVHTEWPSSPSSLNAAP